MGTLLFMGVNIDKLGIDNSVKLFDILIEMMFPIVHIGESSVTQVMLKFPHI